MTNPIENSFATVRHSTLRSKDCLSNDTALVMVFKLVEAAQQTWRRLGGHNQLPKAYPRCETQRRYRGCREHRGPQTQTACGRRRQQLSRIARVTANEMTINLFR
jgi:hypothetical protein